MSPLDFEQHDNHDNFDHHDNTEGILKLPVETTETNDRFCREIKDRLKDADIAQDEFAIMCQLEATEMLHSIPPKMSQAQFDHLSLSQATVSRILKGERPYDRFTVFLWLRVLQKWYRSSAARVTYARLYNTLPPDLGTDEVNRLLGAAGYNTEHERVKAVHATDHQHAIARAAAEEEKKSIRIPKGKVAAVKKKKPQFGRSGLLEVFGNKP